MNARAGKSSKRPAMVARKAASKGDGSKVVLLSGGNPQIPKGDGDEPVQAYIEAMPGWKSDIGRRLDDLIVRTAPGVRKAVRWNSPWYGIEGQGWFVSYHVFTPLRKSDLPQWCVFEPRSSRLRRGQGVALGRHP